MNTRSISKPVVFGFCVAFAAGLALPASAANAAPHPAAKSAHAHGGAWRQGGSHTRTTQTQRTADGHTRNTVVTDAQGRTATRAADVEVDRAAGTKSRDVTYTGRDGQVRTVEDDRTRTDEGYQRTTVATGANGAQSTRNVDVSHDKDTQTTVKTVTVDRTPAP